MKKLIFFALFAVMIAAGASAQRIAPQTMTGTGDTVTNAGTDSLTYTMTTNNTNMISIHLSVSRISGTLAGTATLYGSNNDSTWFAIPTEKVNDTAGFNYRTSDVLTLTNVAAVSKIWVVSPAVYKRYKVVVTGSGTMAARIAGILVGFKYD